jgi:hypothetical protein
MVICRCRMQSYVCSQLDKPDVYLSPMHITQRVIMGYHIPDTHARLVNLGPKDKEKVRQDMINDLQGLAGEYIYRAMKKAGERGCVYAAHQFG